jgi:methyl-accepting chemotaxis protein
LPLRQRRGGAAQRAAATNGSAGTETRDEIHNRKLGTRLIAAFVFVCLIGAIVSGVGIYSMGLVDEEADQLYNILALNAAVEAARAGEQGRGFALVAGEVRSLASRSAEAAREIKRLIGSSVERVEQGSALVAEAGSTMGDVVNAIQRVSEIVAEISAASAEQSSGVSQVGDAVSQMDQVTQQNAALVEESAAAAESLRGQAHQLVQAVAVFRC